MSWTYSGDPSASKLDECRFIVGDTSSTAPIMQDEEIRYLIDLYENDNVLKYNLFRRVATLFARDIKRTLGPQSEDPTARLEYFNNQALEYKRKLSSAGLSLPTYAYPKAFFKGLHSNPPYDGEVVL